jgi:outer membrane protein OmpA-like peptidoglycan-associated protein
MPTTTYPLRTFMAGLGAAALLAGCTPRAQQGAVIGAAGGAIAGGAIGAATGSTAKGAIIGAAVGGAAGAVIGDIMDRQARELEREIDGATVERVGEGIQVTFESGLLYDFDSERLRPEARENLAALARSLQEHSGENLVIVGHTDSVGTVVYNQRLAERRAESAASYLISQGVARDRIATTGLGETEPVADNSTESGRQANRRIEVAIFAGEEMVERARLEAGR